MGKRSRRIRNLRSAPAESAGIAPASERDRTREFWVYVVLLLATLAVYSQVRHFEFVNFDDPEYVIENNHVRAGLTRGGVAWAFTSYDSENWFPLTWLSHMADCQFFGLRSGRHHLTNVLFHVLASLLLFAALKRMTGAVWRSALVAFLFALHPLHVESVAWIAERKDVLCALFWFLTLWCYARYAERPGTARYLLVLLAFCGGLMSKPMIVTLPFVLLLLDVWPLRRANRLAVLWEKAPFFALSAALSIVNYVAQHAAIQSARSFPAGLRVSNAVVTYIVYIARMFWPAKLAVFYPYPHQLPLWRVAVAGFALVSVTVMVLRWRRSQPYLAVGWFWYLGTLVPVIGLIQVGGQSSADRYTYVPIVGLIIMIGWGTGELVERWPRARYAVVIAAAAVCLACVLLTWFQLPYWANGGTLFQHAVDVTTDNYLAQNNLADYDRRQKRIDEALDHTLEALRIKPDYPLAHINLAAVFKDEGKIEESEYEYRVALSLQPNNVEAHSSYGLLLLDEGRTSEALREFSLAVQLRPRYAAGHYVLGRVLASMGRNEEAAAQFLETIRLRPDHADAHHSLGVLFLTHGKMNEALVQFGAEARLKPDDASIHYSLGRLLASAGRLGEAMTQFSEALRINPNLDAARQSLETTSEQQAGSGRP